MKKSFALVAGMFTIAAAIIVSTTSCKKEEVAPAADPPVISTPASGVVLFNQGGSADKFYSFTGTTSGYSTSTGVDFDIAYGNGSTSGNEYFLGGPTDASIRTVHGITVSGGNTVTFYNLTVTAAEFDALTSSQTITDALLSGNTVNSATNQGTRIQSATAWAVGTVFGFETNTHYVMGKVTEVPTGSRSNTGVNTSGSIRVQFKFSEKPSAVAVE